MKKVLATKVINYVSKIHELTKLRNRCCSSTTYQISLVKIFFSNSDRVEFDFRGSLFRIISLNDKSQVAKNSSFSPKGPKTPKI